MVVLHIPRSNGQAERFLQTFTRFLQGQAERFVQNFKRFLQGKRKHLNLAMFRSIVVDLKQQNQITQQIKRQQTYF